MSHLRGIPTVASRALRRARRLLRRRRADEPARVRRHGHRASTTTTAPTRASTTSSSRTRRAGSSGCASSARGAPRRVFWAADPELFKPLPVEKEHDVFFYGYGDKFRREWMRELVGEPSRRLPEVDFALGGEDFRGDIGNARAARGDPVQRVQPRDLRVARCAQRDASRARDRARVVDRAPVRARDGGCGDRLEPARRDRDVVRARPRAPRGRGRRRGDRRVPRAARRPRPRRRSSVRERASGRSTSTRTRTVPVSLLD